MKPQLLDLFATSPTFTNFIPLNNENVLRLLQESSSQFTHIIGAAQSGKSHLLKAWASSISGSGVFIDAADEVNLRELAVRYQYIAIDNVEQLNNDKQIELFDLFNKIKLNNLPNLLLTSSSANLDSIANLRKDLKTRLLSGINLHLKALNDYDLEHAITLFTEKEGIALAAAEKNYLINHYTRSIGVLIQAIHKLAEAAVIEKRNITIPFIKHVLRITSGE